MLRSGLPLSCESSAHDVSCLVTTIDLAHESAHESVHKLVSLVRAHDFTLSVELMDGGELNVLNCMLLALDGKNMSGVDVECVG